MERSLLWSVLALGWAGWLCGLLLARTRLMGAAKRLSVIPRPYLITAIALPLLVFLATLPSRPPLFETGHGLGNGFLLGGLGALLSALVPLLSARSEVGETNPLRAAATLAAPHALALGITAIPLLFLRDTLLDVLLGIAIGWFCVVVTLYVGLLQNRNDGEQPASLPLTLLSGVGFVALLCTVAALGELRGSVTDEGVPDGVSLSAIGLTFAAGIPFLLLLTSLPNRIFLQISQSRADAARLTGTSRPVRIPLAAYVWRTLLSIGILAVLGRLLSRHLLEKELPKSGGLMNLVWLTVGPSHLFHVMGIGLIAGLVAWWLTATRNRQERETQDSTSGWQNGALALLTLLAGFMAAYQLAKGLGASLMLTGAWISFALALTFGLEREENGETKTADAPLQTPTDLLRLGFFSLVLLLYRLLSSRFDVDATGIALTDHYALFGLLLGAMLPLLLSGFLLRPVSTITPLSSTSSTLSLLRLVGVGAILLAVPTLVIVVWGAKCILALLIGLALSIAFESVRGAAKRQTGGDASAPSASLTSTFLPALFALGTGLALSQWTGHVLQMWQFTRAEKIHILVYIVIALSLLTLLADYGGRFLNRGRGPVLPDGAKGAAS